MFAHIIWKIQLMSILWPKQKYRNMKKILEVHQYSDTDIRFNTDIDVSKNSEIVLDIVAKVIFAMSTKLWGGNELSVLAMVRALSIADLSISVNRKEMIKQLDESSRIMAKNFQQTLEEMKKAGGKVMTFGPGVMPGSMKS